MNSKFFMVASVSLAVLVSSIAYAQGPGPGPDGEQPPRRGGGGSGLGGYTEVTESGRVPDHLYNIILGQPTDDSIVVSVLSHQDMTAYLEYGMAGSGYTSKTDSLEIGPRQAVNFKIDGLQKDHQYNYRMQYQLAGQTGFESSEQYVFHTQRAFDSDFVFTVQADSHLDENTSGEAYTNALQNALSNEPDFHLALGDTFMTDKYIEYQQSEPQYLAQRYYFGTQLTHSAPLFFALGNHDAEGGNAERTQWSTNTRNKYLPNPGMDDFYSGNPEMTENGDFVRNYYSWEWGNSQFIALDPFRYSVRVRGGQGGNGNWYMTLGKDQYDWLAETLENSDATFKFVYLHNLVGGAASNRGGAEASLNFEWGGHEFDGTYTFAENRPGWDQPIHDLLVENGVSVVFHGHDHMYIQQERDGIVYQLVPQPGHPSGNVNSAEGYGYLSGNIVQGSGHLTVSVSEDVVDVEFIDSRANGSGQLLHSYQIQAKN